MTDPDFDLDGFKDDLQLTVGEHTLLAYGNRWWVCNNTLGRTSVPCTWKEEHQWPVNAQLSHRKHVADKLVELMAAWAEWT